MCSNNLQISLQNLCSLPPWIISFQKAKIFLNLTTESGSKQKFSLFYEKVVIQAVPGGRDAMSLRHADMSLPDLLSMAEAWSA